MFTTGNKAVDAIGQLHLEGNVIPHQWFNHIKFENGKPDLTAIIILSEIIYWYRPVYEKDETTGQLIGMRKRFKSDLLQRSYDSFSEQFGITKRQAKDALGRLEAAGLIQRHLRTVKAHNTTLPNVLFIELLHLNVIDITLGRHTAHVEMSEVSRSNVTPITLDRHASHIETPEVSHSNGTPVTLERQTNTEITTEITTKENNCRKRVYDESSVYFQLANMLYEKILLDDASFKKPNLNTWADHVRLMMERDGRTEEQIEYLISWSQQNDFWKSHILSTKKLREKATTLIRQIKAEHKKESTPKYSRGRVENVPEWFATRNEQQPTLAAAEIATDTEIDFEQERQKFLAKLGGDNIDNTSTSLL